MFGASNITYRQLIDSGGFRGGRAGHAPPKIRKANVIQR
jgi:hypothetical protein